MEVELAGELGGDVVVASTDGSPCSTVPSLLQVLGHLHSHTNYSRCCEVRTSRNRAAPARKRRQLPYAHGVVELLMSAHDNAAKQHESGFEEEEEVVVVEFKTMDVER